MTPRKIALLTDSCADLNWKEAREKGIFFVPLRILCQDRDYADGVDINGTEVCRRLREGQSLKTSLPRPEDFATVLGEIFCQGYDGVVAVMLSSGLSGTYNLARVMAEDCIGRGRTVQVFDSLSGSLGQGMTLLQLAEDIRTGMDWGELTQRRVPQLIASTFPFFSVDTLEFLQKGGRIGRVRALAGSMLQIRPIIGFTEDGQLQSVARVRGRHQVEQKLIDLVKGCCQGHKRYNLAVAHGDAPERMEALRQHLLAALPEPEHIWEGKIDATLSAYIGDGVLGAAVQVLD